MNFDDDDRHRAQKIFETRNTKSIHIMTTDTPMPDAESAVTYPHLILPGELLSTILSQPLKLGPGLRHSTSPQGDTLIQATQAGLLHRTKHSEFYVDYNSRRVLSLPYSIDPKSSQLSFCVVCSWAYSSTFLARGNL